MPAGEIFERIVRAVTRRPLVPLTAVAVLAVAGTLFALRLDASTSTDPLIPSGSETHRETERFARDFGDDAIVVLVEGDLQRTLLTSDLGRLIQLEGCLSGNVPERALRSLPDVCRELAELHPARAVLGPGTFLNTSANEIVAGLGRMTKATERQARRAERKARGDAAAQGLPPDERERAGKEARAAVEQRAIRRLLTLALRYGITTTPTVDSPEFVAALAFESDGQTPKSRFAYLFPSKDAAVIQMRLRPVLTDAERSRAIGLVRRATDERRLQPENGARYVVTGVPVVVDGLGEAVQGAIPWLLLAAVLIMAATLGLVFRTRLRLLPLALALAASAITFGVLSLVGGELTAASIAVLPVLIGLAVDYAIQFQARFDEQRAAGRSPAEAAPAAAAAGGPTILAAGVATAIGFLVLLTSPIPMVRGFGGLLVVGIAVALACAAFAGFAALVRWGGESRSVLARSSVARLGERLRARGHGIGRSAAVLSARRWLHELRLGAIERGERALATAVSRPGRVLAIGLALAAVGWVADTQSEVVSDVRELVPSDLQALQDIERLQEESGVSGEVDVVVRADDVTDPKVVAWMTRFQRQVLEDAGYDEGARCNQEQDPPELCPALSLAGLVGGSSGSDARRASRLLGALPDYLSQGVITADRKAANLAFGIRLQSLDSQKEVIDRIRERLDPPPGVDAAVVGLPVLAAEANAELSSPLRRWAMLLAALAAVFLVLLVLRRNARDAAIPLIPIALATGWSGGIMFLLGLLPGPLEVELNPMSVTLGALVIAISTEFSILLSSRYHHERANAPAVRAIETTYASTGAAVLASGITAIAGFAALAASDIRMLRDFGILTVVDLTVALIGVMLVLPAALVWAEQRGWARMPRIGRPALRPLRFRSDDA